MGIDSDRLIGQCLIIVCRVGLAILIDEDGRNQTYPRPEERLGPQLRGRFFFFINMVGERWVHVGSSADSESCGALSAEPGYGAITSTESPLRGRGEGPGGSVLLCLVAGGCRELTYSAGVAVTATISFPSQDAATKAVCGITQVVNLRREWIVLPAISKTHLKFEISDFSLTCFPWKFPSLHSTLNFNLSTFLKPP